MVRFADISDPGCPVILLLLFAGYIAAFVFLLLASLGRGIVRRILVSLAMLGLIVQGGCVFVFTGGDRSLIPGALFGCVPFVVWAGWLWLLEGSFGSESSMDCPSCGGEVAARTDRCRKCGWSRTKGW